MNFKQYSKWDHHSDQPHVIRDPKLRAYIRRRALLPTAKIILTTVVLLPFVAIGFLITLLERRQSRTVGFFGMGLCVEKDPVLSRAYVEELGIERILLRIRLSEMHRLDEFIAFAETFREYDQMVSIIQDRDHIECGVSLEASLRRIFTAFQPYCRKFKIGNAVNRKKWAFFHMDEYLRFFKTAQKLRDREFPALELVGPSVIDFEYQYIVRALFNLQGIRFNMVNTLLYVDRQGAPENRHLNFTLVGKILLLHAIVKLSPNCERRIIITEANWPLAGTSPYAPTSERECVSEEDYASFIVRYHLLALATGCVESVYWHQLFAPGYGLIDTRSGYRKYKAFEACRTLVHFIQGATHPSLRKERGRYTFTCRKADLLIEVLWSMRPYSMTFPPDCTLTSRDGDPLPGPTLMIGEAPVYVSRFLKAESA